MVVARRTLRERRSPGALHQWDSSSQSLISRRLLVTASAAMLVVALSRVSALARSPDQRLLPAARRFLDLIRSRGVRIAADVVQVEGVLLSREELRYALKLTERPNT